MHNTHTHTQISLCVCVCVCVLAAQSGLTVRDPMDRSPPGSSVHGVPQPRIVEWVAMPFSRRSSQLRDRTPITCSTGRFFTIWATREIYIITYYICKAYILCMYVHLYICKAYFRVSTLHLNIILWWWGADKKSASSGFLWSSVSSWQIQAHR